MVINETRNQGKLMHSQAESPATFGGQVCLTLLTETQSRGGSLRDFPEVGRVPEGLVMDGLHSEGERAGGHTSQAHPWPNTLGTLESSRPPPHWWLHSEVLLCAPMVY